MALLATRFMITAAVALAAAAQVVVSPASCCLLRAAPFADGACRHGAAEPARRSCCHGHGAERAAGPSAVASHGSPDGGECLWCSAGPKTAANDRVSPPAKDAAALPLSVVAVEPFAPAPVSSRLVVKEPFRRTALAACAWLCVWRK